MWIDSSTGDIANVVYNAKMPQGELFLLDEKVMLKDVGRTWHQKLVCRMQPCLRYERNG